MCALQLPGGDVLLLLLLEEQPDPIRLACWLYDVDMREIIEGHLVIDVVDHNQVRNITFSIGKSHIY